MVQKLRKKNTRAKKVRQNTTCQTKCKKICSVMRKKSKKHKDLRKMKKTKKKLLINSLAGEHVRNPFSLRLQRQCIDKLFRALANLVESKSKLQWAFNRIEFLPPGSYIPTTPKEWETLFQENKFRIPNTEVLRKDLIDKTDPYSIVSQAEDNKNEILRRGEIHKDTIGEPDNLKFILDDVWRLFRENIDMNLFTRDEASNVTGINYDDEAYQPMLRLLYGNKDIDKIITADGDITPIETIGDLHGEQLTRTESLLDSMGKLWNKINDNSLELSSDEDLTENEKSKILQQVLCQDINKNVKIINKLAEYNETQFVTIIPFLPSSEFEERAGNVQPAPPYKRPGVDDNILQSALIAEEIEESKVEDDLEESKSPEVSPLRRASGIVAPRRLTFIEPGEEVAVEPGALEDDADDDDCEWGSWPCMAQRTLVGLDTFPTATDPSFDMPEFFRQIEHGTLSINDQLVQVVESLFTNPIVHDRLGGGAGVVGRGPIHVFGEVQEMFQLIPFTLVTNNIVVEYLGAGAGVRVNHWIAYAVDWHYYKLLQYLYKYILIGKWDDEVSTHVREKNKLMWDYLANIGSGVGLKLRNVLTQDVRNVAEATPLAISDRIRDGSMLPQDPENWLHHADRERILPGSGEQPGSYMDPSLGFKDQIQNVFNYLERDVSEYLRIDVLDSSQTPLPRLSWLLWQQQDGPSQNPVGEECYKKWLRYCVNIEYYRLLILIKTIWDLSLAENTTADQAYHFCESELPDIMGYMPLHTNGFIGMNGDEGVFGQLLWRFGE